MGFEVNVWVTIILGLFTLAMLVAAGFAIVRSTLIKTRLEILQGLVADQGTRVDFLEEERTRLKAEKNALAAKVEILERVVTAKEELKLLYEELRSHDKRVEDKHNVLTASMRESYATLNHTVQGLSEIARGAADKVMTQTETVEGMRRDVRNLTGKVNQLVSVVGTKGTS